MKSNKDTITINRKVIPGFVVLAPITGILIGRGDPAGILLWMGVFVGIYIGKNL